MKNILLIIVFALFAFNPAFIFSQKKDIRKKQNKPTEVVRRIEIVAEPQVENKVWKELISEEGNFKILFPKEPEKLIRDKDFSRGNSFIEYKLWTNFRKYSVSFGDLGAVKSLSDNQLKEIYDKMRDGIIKDAKGNLINDNNINVGNVFGREIIYEQENYLVTNRYFFYGSKLYQIITAVEKKLSSEKNVQKFGNKFLDSFDFVR